MGTETRFYMYHWFSCINIDKKIIPNMGTETNKRPFLYVVIKDHSIKK